MSSPSPSPSTPPVPVPIPDDTTSLPPFLPLPLSASVLLDALPRDAHTALAQTETEGNARVPEKVKIRFQPISSAPALPLKLRTARVSSSQRFETVVGYLRKKLVVGRGEGVFCYVGGGSVFAPGLDEGVGGLWECFRTGLKGEEQLVVGYSMTPAFG